jgi:hypothetical protein
LEKPERVLVTADGEVVLYSKSGMHRPTLAEVVAAPVVEAPATAEPAPQEKEKKTTVTVSGKLKSKPQEGKPDSKGNPTAWSRMAVHEDGRKDAHLYIATFHRHTTAIALGLEQDATVTIEGYPHPSRQKGRMDTFSVIALHKYPGMPEKQIAD